ncbi:hypothetical protein AB833_16850 [Chromatiales bacterium (ex Bugula neritina AB1)]|nr:hypothetical protein AB833_16850 [Chromatiales bacterium (ex Bugula neritina AB1)]
MFHKIYNHLFPSTCVFCDEVSTGSRDLCKFCRQLLPLNSYCCTRCALPLPASPVSDLTNQTVLTSELLCGQCLRSPSDVIETIAPYLYRPPVDYMIKRLKFAGELKYSRIIGEILSDTLITHLKESTPDLLIPVPLHKQRLLERGYNQAFQIATLVSKKLEIEIDNDSVIRVAAQTPQSRLGAKARDINIKRAFKVIGNIQGKNIAIIDDVYTTGATALSLTSSLYQAGAASVSIWVFARTP